MNCGNEVRSLEIGQWKVSEKRPFLEADLARPLAELEPRSGEGQAESGHPEETGCEPGTQERVADVSRAPSFPTLGPEGAQRGPTGRVCAGRGSQIEFLG